MKEITETVTVTQITPELVNEHLCKLIANRIKAEGELRKLQQDIEWETKRNEQKVSTLLSVIAFTQDQIDAYLGQENFVAQNKQKSFPKPIK